MENPELISVTTLFMREHNLWVRTLKAQHPTWTGTQLYNMAKALTTAEYQHIVYTEYLPALVGPQPPYSGFNPQINPQVTQEFSTAGFRVGHSQISDTQNGIDNQGAVVFTQPLAQAFFNTPAVDEAHGIDALLRSLGQDFSQATDVYAVSALRNLLVAGLVGGNVDEIDLIAIDIQRNRDVGINTLNQTRKALGLAPYSSFAALTSDPVLQNSFQKVYGSIDNVDLFMGGMAEKHVPGAVVGETFKRIITDQFKRLRDGDPWYWRNQGFDPSTSAMIAGTTLRTLMERNTPTTNLQADLFIQAKFPVLNQNQNQNQQNQNQE
jgi:peroxidase